MNTVSSSHKQCALYMRESDTKRRETLDRHTHFFRRFGGTVPIIADVIV